MLPRNTALVCPCCAMEWYEPPALARNVVNCPRCRVPTTTEAARAAAEKENR